MESARDRTHLRAAARDRRLRDVGGRDLVVAAARQLDRQIDGAVTSAVLGGSVASGSSDVIRTTWLTLVTGLYQLSVASTVTLNE
jgi:hypothetical protein